LYYVKLTQTTIINETSLINSVIYANLFTFRALFFATNDLPSLGKHVHVELWKNYNICI